MVGQVKACLVDGNSLFARAWYATRHVRDGQPFAGACAALRSLLALLRPDSALGGVDQLLVCWDTKSKSQKPRAKKPDDYYAELDLFSSALARLLNAAQAIPPAHEADDCIATVVYRLLDQPIKLFVVSGDKDLQQLQGGNVHYYCLNEKAVLSKAYICHRWKVKQPVQVALALAILGDAGDGVPGLRGWGIKKVEKLFERVTAEMNFQQALDVIDSQLPACLKPAFYESLDLTLLDPAVPNVPDPAPIVWGDSNFLTTEWGNPELQAHVEQVKLECQGLDSALDFTED